MEKKLKMLKNQVIVTPLRILKEKKKNNLARIYA